MGVLIKSRSVSHICFSLLEHAFLEANSALSAKVSAPVECRDFIV